MIESVPVTRPRRIFIAGSTGATGRTILRLAGPSRPLLVPYERPKATPPSAGAVAFDLADRERLVAELKGCTTVIQLIGTMRNRFARGDTYESSDIATTRQLVAAAQVARIDHFLLLSSVGAGRPYGAYLKAKAEAIVLGSSLPYTILRPSAFIGEGHQVPQLAVTVAETLGLDTYRPIAIEDLALTILDTAVHRSQLGALLQGTELWKAVAEARSHARLNFAAS
jgi:uncharacterized protein YbjT (DUF2867 family)